MFNLNVGSIENQCVGQIVIIFPLCFSGEYCRIESKSR